MPPLREGQKRDFARSLRRNATDAEHALWRVLRARSLQGWKFRRQVPIGAFVVDFACLDAMLVVEVDGGQHAEDAEADARRTAYLARQGFRVLRFWNHDVLTNLSGVVDVILRALPQEHPHPGPAPRPGLRKQRGRSAVHAPVARSSHGFAPQAGEGDGGGSEPREHP